MSKRFLVIVESPGKLKKLKHILGVPYTVMASMGHVTDLPHKSFGIDVATMQPDYEVIKADVVKRLRAEAKKPYETIYLAADPDREGGSNRPSRCRNSAEGKNEGKAGACVV